MPTTLVPRILLLGPDGQVGWELRRALACLGEVIAVGRRTETSAWGTLVGDLTQPDELERTVERLAPEVVVNAAAYTAVDKAESEPDLAMRVNEEAPGRLAQLLAARGGWLVHFSTDYVFDGSGAAARDEAAEPSPLSVYGHTKLAGEQAIQASGCKHLIFRTSWVHAARGSNFARTMLRLAAEREALRVVDDQVGAPTGADLLADATSHALRQAMVDPALQGLYHLVAGGEVSWCQYARHVLGWAQARGLALRAGPQQVEGIPSTGFPTPARRPLNSRLATGRFQSRFGLRLPDWRVGVERMLAEVLHRPLDLTGQPAA